MTQRLSLLQCGAGLMAAASGILLGLFARLPVPYRDDWAMLLWLMADPGPAAYFIPHNEHVIPLTRLIFAAQYHLEGSSGYTIVAIALASLVVIAGLTLREIGRRWPDDVVMRRSVGGVALVILFFAWQLQSMVFPTAVVFPVAQMFAVVALVCLLDATEPGGRHRVAWLAAAALASVLAALTVTHGLAVPIMLAIVAFARRAGSRVVVAFLSLAVAGVAAYLYALFAGPVPAGLALEGAGSPGQVLVFFLAFYASLLAQVSTTAGVVIGSLLFAAGLAVVLLTMFKGPGRARIEHFAAGVLLFGMAGAALAAPTRVEFGIAQVAQSRYASFVLPYWAALVLAGASAAGYRQWQRVAPAALATSIAALGAQAGIGAVWLAKADNVATAGLALSSGVRDDEWIRTLYPEPALVYDLAVRLRARGDRWLESPLLERPFEPNGSPVCDGTMALAPVPEGSGLRLQGAVSTPASSGVLFDRSGRPVGLARPAPIASAPNPSPMDIARAVGRAMVATAPGHTEWIGFAAAGDGGPYVVQLMDADGSSRCRLTIQGP
jgi:hypothetical protein